MSNATSNNTIIVKSLDSKANEVSKFNDYITQAKVLTTKFKYDNPDTDKVEGAKCYKLSGYAENWQIEVDKNGNATATKKDGNQKIVQTEHFKLGDYERIIFAPGELNINNNKISGVESILTNTLTKPDNGDQNIVYSLAMKKTDTDKKYVNTENKRDVVFGGAGADLYVTKGVMNGDVFSGGKGTDVLVLEKKQEDYTITFVNKGYLIEDKNNSQSYMFVKDVEQIRFKGDENPNDGSNPANLYNIKKTQTKINVTSFMDQYSDIIKGGVIGGTLLAKGKSTAEAINIEGRAEDYTISVSNRPTNISLDLDGDTKADGKQVYVIITDMSGNIVKQFDKDKYDAVNFVSYKKQNNGTIKTIYNNNVDLTKLPTPNIQEQEYKFLFGQQDKKNGGGITFFESETQTTEAPSTIIRATNIIQGGVDNDDYYAFFKKGGHDQNMNGSIFMGGSGTDTVHLSDPMNSYYFKAVEGGVMIVHRDDQTNYMFIGSDVEKVTFKGFDGTIRPYNVKDVLKNEQVKLDDKGEPVILNGEIQYEKIGDGNIGDKEKKIYLNEMDNRGYKGLPPIGKTNGSTKDDTFVWTNGTYLVDGNAGVDTLVLSGPRSKYHISKVIVDGEQMLRIGSMGDTRNNEYMEKERKKAKPNITTDGFHAENTDYLYVKNVDNFRFAAEKDQGTEPVMIALDELATNNVKDRPALTFNEAVGFAGYKGKNYFQDMIDKGEAYGKKNP